MKTLFSNQLLSQAELFNVRGGNDNPIKVPENVVLLPPPPEEEAK